LWCRLAAVAPIQPLAWELPCAVGRALKEAKKGMKLCLFAGRQKRGEGEPDHIQSKENICKSKFPKVVVKGIEAPRGA